MASNTDLIMQVSSGGRPVVTQLVGDHQVGQNSINVGSTTNWETQTAVTFIIYKIGIPSGQTTTQRLPETQSEWVGTVTGNQITNMVLTGGNDQPYSDGDTVMCAPTAEWGDRLARAVSTHADQDGTLKAGAVDSAAVLANDVVETSTIKNKAVTLPKINGGTTAGVLTADDNGNVSVTGNYSTSEASTNTTWIDGKTIYQRVVQTTVSANANVATSGTISVTGATQILDIRGYWVYSSAGNATKTIGSGEESNNGNKYRFFIYSTTQSTLNYETVSPFTRSNAPVVLIVTYTKA